MKESKVMQILKRVFGISPASKAAEQRADRVIAKKTPRPTAGKTRSLVGAATVLLLLVSIGCKCPPGPAANLANVEAIVAENDAARATAGEPESVRQAKAIRNREALDLARKMVEACK